MSDANPPPTENHSPIIRKNDYILLVVDNISLSDITTGALVFIIIYVLLYFSLQIWAYFKDKQKQTYSSKVAAGGSNSTLHIQMPRRTNFRATNIDITSDTLDFTNNSVRMNFEDQKDLSVMFQQTAVDGLSHSPMNRFDASPIRHSKRYRMNLTRTPPSRSFSNLDQPDSVSQTNPHTTITLNDEEAMTTKDFPAISKDDPITSKQETLPITSKDEVTIAKDISHIIEEIGRDEELLSKKNTPTKKRAKERAATMKIKPRQTVKSKFLKLLMQRHAVWSTIERMSRISPRYKRISLMYFLLSCDLFVMTLSFINFSVFEGNKILEIVKASIFSWSMFIIISWLSSVSKEGLKYTKTNDEFQSLLASLEKEAKYKDVAVHVIMGVFTLFALTQFALFVSIKAEHVIGWILCSMVVFVIQMVVFDALWLLGIACIYTRAYDSRQMKKLYRTINSIRFWRI